MSARFSGSVLMLGMRRKVFNSSRKRSRLISTKASLAVDIGFSFREKNHYIRRLHRGPNDFCLRTPRARVGENALHFGLGERLGDQVISAEIERLSPKAGIGKSVCNNHFRRWRALTRQIQHVQPVSVRKASFSQYDLIRVSPDCATRLLQTCNVLEMQGKRAKHVRKEHSIVGTRGDKQHSQSHGWLYLTPVTVDLKPNCFNKFLKLV